MVKMSQKRSKKIRRHPGSDFRSKWHRTKTNPDGQNESKMAKKNKAPPWERFLSKNNTQRKPSQMGKMSQKWPKLIKSHPRKGIVMLFQLGTVDVPGVEITKKIRPEIFHRRYQLNSSDNRYFPERKTSLSKQRTSSKVSRCRYYLCHDRAKIVRKITCQGIRHGF